VDVAGEMSELVEIGLRIFDDWRTVSGALAAMPEAESSCDVGEAGWGMPVATNDPKLPITINNASASSIAFVTRTPPAPILKPSATYLIVSKSEGMDRAGCRLQPERLRRARRPVGAPPWHGTSSRDRRGWDTHRKPEGGGSFPPPPPSRPAPHQGGPVQFRVRASS